MLLLSISGLQVSNNELNFGLSIHAFKSLLLFVRTARMTFLLVHPTQQDEFILSSASSLSLLKEVVKYWD